MAKTNTPKEKPAKKSYKTTKLEVAKTVTIAVLITAVIFFTLGIKYANQHNAEIDEAVNQATAEMVEDVETPVKK